LAAHAEVRTPMVALAFTAVTAYRCRETLRACKVGLQEREHTR
jgi:hypothetical protein